MTDYLEFTDPDGVLYLLGCELEPTRAVARGSTTDLVVAPKTRFTHAGHTYETETAIPSGVCLCATEDGPYTTLEKPLILRRV